MALSMMMEKGAIGLYPNKHDAETAVHTLLSAGFPVESISVVGGEETVNEAAMGSYKPPEFVDHELKHLQEHEGAIVGGALGLLVGFGIFVVAEIGSLIVLGPLVGLIAGAGLGGVLGDIFGGSLSTE